MNSIDNKNCEEWFFRFYEGELSMDEKSDMFRFIDTDPILKDDFELWGKTYIRQPLPQPDDIKVQLLRTEKNGKNRLTIITGAFIILCGAWIAITQTEIRLEEKSYNTNTVSDSNSKAQQNLGDEKIILERANYSKPKVKRHYKISQLNQSTINQDQHIVGEQGKVDKIILTEINEPEKINISVLSDSVGKPMPESAYKQQTKSIKKYNKKLLRKIERQKSKQMQDRRAAQRMQGDIPYVIPTNPDF